MILEKIFKVKIHHILPGDPDYVELNETLPKKEDTPTNTTTTTTTREGPQHQQQLIHFHHIRQAHHL